MRVCGGSSGCDLADPGHTGQPVGRIGLVAMQRDELEEFTVVLYRVTIRLRHWIDDTTFLSATSAYSCGEWCYGLEEVVAAVAASGAPVYPWDHADLISVWKSCGHAETDFPDISICPEGQSPSGNGVITNPPPGYTPAE